MEWDKLGSALGMADSDLKIRENAGEDKDKCKQELFKLGTVILIKSGCAFALAKSVWLECTQAQQIFNNDIISCLDSA